MTMNFEYINKYPEADPFRYRRSLILLGIVISLFLVFILLNITSYGTRVQYLSNGNDLKGIEFFPPLTVIEQPKPKIVPPAVLELVAVDDLTPDNANTEFLNSEIGINDAVTSFIPDTSGRKFKELPPPEIPIDNPPFVITEEMPRFPGCEYMESKSERELCAQEKLMQFIYKSLKYPAISVETGVEGRVVLRFVVTESGNVENVEILRDIGAGCGEEAKKVIETMKNLDEKWIPGRQGGRKVKVYFTLPVVFELKK
jgi:periplasmic protein TonB